MKEWKASEKEAQKMTRDGAISVNMVTGEASHVSDRAPEQDYSPSGDSTALARTASTIWTTGVSGSLRRKSGGTAAKPTGRVRRQIASILPFGSGYQLGELKFAAMNLKKLATWKRKRKNPSSGKRRGISSMDFLSALIFFPFEMKKSVLA